MFYLIIWSALVSMQTEPWLFCTLFYLFFILLNDLHHRFHIKQLSFQSRFWKAHFDVLKSLYVKQTLKKRCMVERATVNRSSRFKAEWEISLFTSVNKNKIDHSCPLVYALQYRKLEWHPMSKLPKTPE